MDATETEEAKEEFYFRPELDEMLEKTRTGHIEPTRSLSDDDKSVLHRIVSHDCFDRVVLFLIFANCIVMILQKEVPEAEDTWKYFERFFLSCFFLEMVLKFLAFGLCRKDAKPPGYFRDGWNWLDFIIVMEGLVSAGIEIFSGEEETPLDISLMRVVRTLRPLRAVTKLPELRVLVEALLKSIPMLGTTILVCAFYFLVFGIAGVQFWQGQYRNRCFFNATATANESLVLDDPYACAISGGGRQCEGNQTCQAWENPNSGITSFDNVLVAWLTIFQAITLEGWVDIMNVGQDTGGAAMWIYFLLMIFLGSYIVLNLSMAVIVNKYQEGKVAAEKASRQAQRRQDRRADARRKWRRDENAERPNLGMHKAVEEAMEAQRQADMKIKAEKGRLKDEWKDVDTDGSGALDREEVRAVMLRMGHEVSEDELTRGFEEMDEDGRGNVDYEEFERWWDRRMTAPEIKRLADSRTGADGPCRQNCACMWLN